MKKERDEFDDVFRSKLQDFEAETDPVDWEAIADRLPGGGKAVPFRHKKRYWVAAAAAVVLLILSGEIYYLTNKPADEPTVTAQVETPAVPADSVPAGPTVVSSAAVIPDALATTAELAVPASKALPKTPSTRSTLFTTNKTETMETALQRQPEVKTETVATMSENKENDLAQSVPLTETKAVKEAEQPEEKAVPVITQENEQPLLATTEKVAETKKQSRWGFGMGGGSYTTGADNSVNAFVLQSSSQDYDKSDDLALLNAPTFYRQAPKTDIEHKTPVSVGLSVSYRLTDRWALQTGLMYTQLKSEWKTNGDYHGESKQKLHYLGVPLGVSYKIGEWKRFQVYGTGSFVSEYKIGGNLKTKIYSKDMLIRIDKEDIGMKPWQFSVNTRVGVSYPIIRFVQVFAEGGVAYYFDNGSSIETIRTEKPFNVNLQVGFRLGF